MTQEEKAKSNKLGIVFTLIGLCFFSFLIYHFGWATLWEALRSAQPIPLLGSVLLLLLGLWVRAWKWHHALGAGNQGVGLFFVAKMAGSWTPGRAGEFAPLLLKEHRTMTVTTWIVTDRVLEVWFTLAVGLLGVWWIGLTPGLLGVGLVAAGIAGTLAMGILVWRRDWLDALANRWSTTPVLGKTISILGTLHEKVRNLRSKMVLIAAVTLFAKWTDLLAVTLLCRAFGYTITLALAGAARCAHALISAIPITPDVSGAPYVAQAAMLHTYGAMPYAVLTAALALEATMVYGVLYGSYILASRKFTL